ncbi:hypothetical protein [Streptomyces sulphureus]|uniref:hypothetical protein n=1 Tax=Streptomyces sulphureus TaxID=47758 RepID=UPI003CCBDF25
MCTSPAPSRPRPEEEAAERALRTETEREELRCESDRERRPETERREDCDRADARDDREEESELLPRRALVIPVGAEPSAPPGATTGARPQVSQ